jgi:hypothetical protein
LTPSVNPLGLISTFAPIGMLDLGWTLALTPSVKHSRQNSLPWLPQMQESTKFSLHGQLRLLYIMWPTPNIIETNKVTHMKICTQMQFVTDYCQKMKQNQEKHPRNKSLKFKKKLLESHSHWIRFYKSTIAKKKVLQEIRNISIALAHVKRPEFILFCFGSIPSSWT